MSEDSCKTSFTLICRTVRRIAVEYFTSFILPDTLRSGVCFIILKISLVKCLLLFSGDRFETQIYTLIRRSVRISVILFSTFRITEFRFVLNVLKTALEKAKNQWCCVVFNVLNTCTCTWAGYILIDE